MKEPETRVLYNDSCPICSWEIDHYRRTGAGCGMAFDTLDRAAEWGLTEDEAARALHVSRGGERLRGMAAFRAIWQTLPGLRWLAWLTGLPVIRPLMAVFYDRVAAPLLYRAHQRRKARTLPTSDH